MPAQEKRLTTLSTVLITVVLLAVGLALMVLGEDWDYLKNHPSLQRIARELGTLLFVTISVSVLWELFAKRSFLNEVVRLVRLTENLQESGISRLFRDLYYTPPWAELFEDTTEFDMVVSYATTWRSTHRTNLLSLSKNKNCRVRVVIANPNSKDLVRELARRYNKTDEEMFKDLTKAIKDYVAFLGKGPASFDLYLSDRACLYTYYRFNNSLLVCLFANHSAMTDRPCILVDRSGMLAKFLRDDFEAFIKGLKPHFTAPSNARSET